MGYIQQYNFDLIDGIECDITPVSSLSIDRYNYRKVADKLTLDDHKLMLDDHIKRGGDPSLWLHYTLSLDCSPECKRWLWQKHADTEQQGDLYIPVIRTVRKNENKEWCIKNEAEIKELYRKTGNKLGTIRKIANGIGILDEAKIASLKVSAYRLNYFEEL